MTNGLFDLAVRVRKQALLIFFVVILIVLAAFAGWQLVYSQPKVQAVGGCSAMRLFSEGMGRA